MTPAPADDPSMEGTDMTGNSTVASAPARLRTPADFSANATEEIAAALNALLADVFALYLKTKNFHWHVSGPNFYGYHLMFDEQAAQILAATDDMAERARKIGGTTLRSTGHIARLHPAEPGKADVLVPDALPTPSLLAVVLPELLDCRHDALLGKPAPRRRIDPSPTVAVSRSHDPSYAGAGGP